MKDQFQELYEKLLSGIHDIEQDRSDHKTQIASCFHLCERVRRQVDDIVRTTAFADEDGEISFFKTIKPAFTLLVEFYSILYRTTLFIPDMPSGTRQFWQDELQRVDVFLHRHSVLLNYLNARDDVHDREYFLRQPDAGPSAPYDELIAKLLARQQYRAYVLEQLNEIDTEDVNP